MILNIDNTRIPIETKNEFILNAENKFNLNINPRITFDIINEFTITTDIDFNINVENKRIDLIIPNSIRFEKDNSNINLKLESFGLDANDNLGTFWMTVPLSMLMINQSPHASSESQFILKTSKNKFIITEE